jgi:hypothetical protein
MKEEDIEIFVEQLDKKSRDMCVYPDRQTFDCCDCYLCRVDYFNKIREELRNERN